MHEFTTVSASSYDPAALAAKLTEKSAEGWSVVSIVSTGGDVTAFLSKAAAGGAAAATAAAVSEPAGWAVAPESSAPAQVAAPAPAPAPAAAAPATPSIPADWYADPSGRFELRYWNGTAWTEHVARAGQQYTDPPVA
jgi:hypothetical protein